VPATRTQYTIRNVPKQLDAALRRRARIERKAMNQVVLEAPVPAVADEELRQIRSRGGHVGLP